ncbi:Aste57867_17027 [Aphanomyces stellatus]|uniref:Peptide deformylase n=1 Tax=Aphanomyces stellatus TaxID=120398 RepID=A0A485L6X2_9STRA|nr:hypothetical protein As57867_016969 [Aphanomyces stellatus]VFT93788.1 Aste57867_17027 [Aphanomyces stellatus]
MRFQAQRLLRPRSRGFAATPATGAVLPLGSPSLLLPCAAVPPSDILSSTSLHHEMETLRFALTAFRLRHGFGRGIAAPQLGIQKRFVAIQLPRHAHPYVYLNPEITWQSPETFTMWDDCMCFPDILVRVTRHTSISLRFLDDHGVLRDEDALPQAESELFQHELDHLDGRLAVHLVDPRPLSVAQLLDEHPTRVVRRHDFEADRAKYQALVDYVI